MSDEIYLLDTNVCIDLLRMSPEQIPPDMRHLSQESLILSSIVLAELETGVWKSARSAVHSQRLSFLASHMTIAPFDSSAAGHYGKIRADLEKKGISIGPLDLLIAAHARSIGALLVSGNLREFERVPQLRCQPWLPR